MERRRISCNKAAILVALVILTNGVIVNAQVYACGGGCYNDCFLRSNKSRSDMLACYFQCLNTCVPRSAADSRYYCQIGCSLERCIPTTNDGRRLERCFSRCDNLCKS